MSLRRRLLAAALLVAASPLSAFAQAPATAPLVLTLPSSARVAALGGAWVAGRDQDVVFTNPAQLIGTRTDFSASFLRFGPAANGATLTSAYAAGKMSFTLGWGLQFVNFTDAAGQSSPFPQDVLLTRGVADVHSTLATVAGAIVYKGFRLGAAGKFAADRSDVNRHAMLLDLGLARTLFGGVGAVAVQNLGRHDLAGTPLAPLPRQVAFGWSRPKSAGPMDLALFTQVMVRDGWTSPAAGLEAGYSWIEGYSVTLRAGVRRPESTAERPVAIGAAFTGDRLTLEYAVRFFDTGNRAHMVTLRWR
jgi:hypothetical protein